MTILVNPPRLLDSTLAPANGSIVARVTNTFLSGGDLVTRAAGRGVIVNGEFRDATGTGPFILPATPEGTAVELWVILNEWRDGRHQTVSSSRTVSVPATATVTWDDLVDVAPVLPSGDYAVPTWAGELLAAKATAVTAAGTATDAATAAEAAAAEAEAAMAGLVFAAASENPDEVLLVASGSVQQDPDDAGRVLVTTAESGTFTIPTVESLTATFARRPSSLTSPDEPLRPLRELLDADMSAQMQVIGDSTGNEPGEWVYLTAQELSTEYPAHTVRHYLWNDATQKYDAPTILQSGEAGERGIDFGTQGAWLPASGALVTSPDLDIRVKVAFDTWPLAANGVILNRGYTAGQFSLRLLVSNAGAVMARFSRDGTTNEFSSAFTVTGVTPGTPIWLRFTYKADNGASQHVQTFYQSTDGITWTQIGQGLPGGVGSLHNSTQDWELGAEGFVGSPLDGKIYEVRILDGIDGRLVSPLLTDEWRLRSSTTASRFGAPVLAVVNGSHPGGGITYFNDATRAPKLLLPANPAVVLMSISHNDGEATGWQYLTEWDTLLTRVRDNARSAATPVVVTQNPQIAPAPYIDAHARRRVNLSGWSKKNAVDFLDVFAAFADDPRGVAALLNVDGLHPNAAGSELWRDTTLAGLGLN